MAAGNTSEILHAGERAPDFNLGRLEGGSASTVSMAGLLADGPVLLAFFKTTCPVCQLTLPILDRLHQGQQPLRLVGVSQDDAETTREFNSQFGVTMPMLLDTDESGYPASNAYGLSHVPSMFLVERDGTIAWSSEGFNKRELQGVAAKAGVELFRPDDNVPEWKAG